MNYVNSFDLFGVPAKQIPSITGKGAPTMTTEGAVGCLYMDEYTGDLYKCTSVANSTYVWGLVSEGGNSGISDTARTLLVSILRSAIYSDNQSANITALETALKASSGGSSGGVSVYTIINSLSNVVSNNSNTSIVANSSYTATLTATDGYAFESVSVTMGGEDVTETVWNAETGVITITAVTGDILITATAVESAAAVTSWLYHFDNNLYPVGEKDFGFSILNDSISYTEGKYGNALNLSTLYKQDLTEYPMLDGDFTIALWVKRNKIVNNDYIIATTSSNAWPYNKTTIPYTLVDTENWTVSSNNGRSATQGFNMFFNSANVTVSMVSADETAGIALNLIPNTSIAIGEWHHYALTRKDDSIMFFFDGKLICKWTYEGELYSANRIVVNGLINTSGAVINSNNYIDELLIDDENCRYTEDFTVPTIPYVG